MWEVEQCEYGKLKNALNAIENHGGTIFQVLESGDRREFACIVWFRHAVQAVKPMAAVPFSKSSNASR